MLTVLMMHVAFQKIDYCAYSNIIQHQSLLLERSTNCLLLRKSQSSPKILFSVDGNKWLIENGVGYYLIHLPGLCNTESAMWVSIFLYLLLRWSLLYVQ